MFLWWNSNSLQIIEFHVDAFNWKRLTADRHVYCCSIAPHLKLWLWKDKTWGNSKLPQPWVCLLTSCFLGCLSISLDSLVMWGQNVFSKWLEIETEHSVRCTKPSYRHMYSEVVSCPAKSCDVRMLWIQCSVVHRSAHCKAYCMLVQVLNEHPYVFHSTDVTTQNTYF